MQRGDPDRTWALLKPHFPELGITRVTDITRLDRLGLPVFAGVRPRGRLLRVHAGKSTQPATARLGAAMEAAEYALVEASADQACTRPGTQLSMREWAGQCPGDMQLQDLCPTLGEPLQLDEPMTMSRVSWLGTSRSLLLPSALFLPLPGKDFSTRLFPWSSTGLAAGASVADATLHALFEVMERDAEAMHIARDASSWLPSTAWPAQLSALAQTWNASGVHLLVRYLSNDFGLPCFQAFLHEPGSADVNLAGGCCLHLRSELALFGAVQEAAQSRLSALQGAREDVTSFFDKYKTFSAQSRMDRERALLARLSDDAKRTTWGEIPDVRVSTTATALREVMRRLATGGFPWVFRLHLTPPGIDLDPLAVVRVLIPRCEQLGPHTRRLGPRLTARLDLHAA